MKRDEKSLSSSFMCKFIDQSLHGSLKEELREERNGGGKEMYPWEGPAELFTQRKSFGVKPVSYSWGGGLFCLRPPFYWVNCSQKSACPRNTLWSIYNAELWATARNLDKTGDGTFHQHCHWACAQHFEKTALMISAHIRKNDRGPFQKDCEPIHIGFSCRTHSYDFQSSLQEYD